MTLTQTAWTPAPASLQAAFGLTAEQDALRSSVRRLLENRASIATVRELMSSELGQDKALWHAMAEIGLPGLVIPERFGGYGFNHVDLAIVLEELGRAVACTPLLATQLVANALLASGDNAACEEFLPAVASGDVIGTLAVAERRGEWDSSQVQVRADAIGSRVLLTGTKTFVLDGGLADLILVSARNGDAIGLYAVAGDAGGLTRRSLPVLDQTRKLAELKFDGVEARRIGPVDGRKAIDKALDIAAVLLAAEQVGVAQRCLDMAVDYAKNRVQFGRPIGSFQAIKHMCADMLVEVEYARSAAYYAAWAAAEDSTELPVVACLVKAACSDAAFKVAGDNIQVHGGIGFTWEHDAHLYFKRATSSKELFGGPNMHRARLADRLGL
jgi:alkylation response protein AidB-like acyl-CoA dehydrogenase